MNETLIIDTQALAKSYGVVNALKRLNLRVTAGSIHALLGKNGAGKTTLIKILMGLAKPDLGAARVFGLSVANAADSLSIRGRVGFVSESKDLPPDMTVAEILRFTATFYPRWDREQEVHYRNRFELPLDRKISQLSQGMRAKLSLLLVLCRHAELLILDEPTAGLDPAAAEDVLQTIVSHVANANTTVLFSSHQIAEVDQIADHVSIIDKGEVVASGEIDSLKQAYCRIQLVFPGELPVLTEDLPGVRRVEQAGRVMSLISSEGSEQVLQRLASLHPSSTQVLPMTLKEIFFEEVGKHEHHALV